MRAARWGRYAAALFILLLTSLVLARRARNESLPPYQNLSSFPSKVLGMQARDLPLSKDDLQVLGPGQFILRNYSSSERTVPINLFIAFFPSQRTGDTIHSPKNCLPGAGWTPLQAQRIGLNGPGGSMVSVERYFIARGDDRDVVLYWYQAHGRITPSEYWAKALLVADAIRLNRTDGSLVRVVAPVDSAASAQDATEEARQFSEAILPLLPNYIPN